MRVREPPRMKGKAKKLLSSDNAAVQRYVPRGAQVPFEEIDVVGVVKSIEFPILAPRSSPPGIEAGPIDVESILIRLLAPEHRAFE